MPGQFKMYVTIGSFPFARYRMLTFLHRVPVGYRIRSESLVPETRYSTEIL